jgi:hypothetical protein
MFKGYDLYDFVGGSNVILSRVLTMWDELVPSASVNYIELYCYGFA